MTTILIDETNHCGWKVFKDYAGHFVVISYWESEIQYRKHFKTIDEALADYRRISAMV